MREVFNLEARRQEHPGFIISSRVEGFTSQEMVNHAYLKSLFNFQTPGPIFLSKSQILCNIALNLAEFDGGNFGPNSFRSSLVVAWPNFVHSNMINSLILLRSSREFSSDTKMSVSSSSSSLSGFMTSFRTLILLKRSLDDTAVAPLVPTWTLVCTLPAREPSKWRSLGTLLLSFVNLLLVSDFSFCSEVASNVFFF